MPQPTPTQPTQTTQPPIPLPFESIDDLIYDARSGDLDALRTDLANLSQQHGCPESAIVASAVDAEPESEGGTGCCLLHFPAANGNFEILSHLLKTLSQSQSPNQKPTPILNHRNNSGNTPLHWAALNTHLPCVKALVEAGADISIKNDAGLDAVFLAERSAWSGEAEEAGKGEQGKQEEAQGEEEADGGGVVSPGRAVVEWLLGCEKGGSLEGPVGGGPGGEGAAEGEGEVDGAGKSS